MFISQFCFPLERCCCISALTGLFFLCFQIVPCTQYLVSSRPCKLTFPPGAESKLAADFLATNLPTWLQLPRASATSPPPQSAFPRLNCDSPPTSHPPKPTPLRIPARPVPSINNHDLRLLRQSTTPLPTPQLPATSRLRKIHHNPQARPGQM